MDQKREFLLIVEQNKGLVYKVAGFFAPDRHERQDLFQEIVYQLWKSFGSFRNESRVTTWMYRVAMNTAICYSRKNRRQQPTMFISSEMLEFPDSRDAETEESFRIMHQQIRELNLLERGIIMLYLEGKSYEEISGLIGISATNVGTRLSRIREKLKQKIAKTR
jgi:RNA polymerase sigma-70 factor (ECF subfamily)